MRARVAAGVRALRTERRWTQAALAARLGLSQARLSEIERGGGSFTAEQLLEVMRIFNVSLDQFAEPRELADELQGALERLGASHLRAMTNALPSERLANVRVAVRETLLAPRDTRLVLALAPVLVANVDALNLDLLQDDMSAVGFPSRVPWLVENVHEALLLIRVAPGRLAATRWHRARTIFGDFIARHPAPQGALRHDHFDSGVRTEHTLAEVVAAGSAISHRWGIVSELQPQHFADALRAANVAD